MDESPNRRQETAIELLQAGAELLKAEAQDLRNKAVKLKCLVSKGEEDV